MNQVHGRCLSTAFVFPPQDARLPAGACGAAAVDALPACTGQQTPDGERVAALGPRPHAREPTQYIYTASV